MVAFATQVKRRRGTTAQNDAFTGAEGEIVVDTERHELRVHDGVTMGGFKIGGGTSLPLLTRLITEHILNDESFLNANTFSWQLGSTYEAVYKHLVDGLSTAGAVQTETIAGITISYKVATDGQRICTPDQETAISQLYAKTGEANFYILDTENARFKLPRTNKRKLIRAVKNDDGSWYNLYSDGWVEQGYIVTISHGAATAGNFTVQSYKVGLLVPTKYVRFSTQIVSGQYGQQMSSARLAQSNAYIDVYAFADVTAGNIDVALELQGYAVDSVLANEPVQYEYYYVGNFERSAIEQTAGLNAELFNNKADLNLMNTASNVDFVIESQTPTAANGYTWYRKYKSGWVEQGGREGSGLGTKRVNLLVPMATNNFTVFITTQSGTAPTHVPAINVISATTIDLLKPNTVAFWEVKGIAA